MLVASAERWALMHELRGAPEPTTEQLIGLMTPVDLVLIEGFKQEGHDKIEVHRPVLGKPLLCAGDPHIVAVASDAALSGLSVPRLDLNDVSAIAPSPKDREMFFGDHFTLNSKTLQHVVRVGYKSAMTAFRKYEFTPNT